MIQNIHRVLAIPSNRISIKATTMERLGHIGNQEGIAAFAVACVEIPD
jgi:2-C-methyl-D-erythritol 4-phosphate cytidylyltransferase/2-C-methyl-D-erythritol 2,4-cyclodiphosphate synthase